MKYFTFAAVIATALLAAAPAAHAQQLTLAIRDGRVTLDAHNVPIRQILTEWARIGGVKIVNGEKVTGPAVTLNLPDVPERQALDIILRGVSGYMLAVRPAGRPGASAFDRILILPTSAGPRNPTPAAAPAPGAFPRPLSPALPFQPPMPVPQVEDEEEVGGEPVMPPSRTTPPRGMPRPVPVQTGIQSGVEEESAAPPVAPTTPSNPFGVPTGSSGRPGVVTPVVPQGGAPGGIQPQLDGAQPR